MDSASLVVKRRAIEPTKAARTFGVIFLLTWVTGIAGRILLDPVYSDPDFLVR
jgi:hypothetical protein